MDRTVKFLLFVIAASLVMLNLQLAGVGLVGEARAGRKERAGMSEMDMLFDRNAKLESIAIAIRGIDCSR
jgi:hypothetical protein